MLNRGNQVKNRVIWVGPHPATKVLIKSENLDTQTWENTILKMKAGTERMYLQAQEHQRLLADLRSQEQAKQTIPSSTQSHQPC